MFISLLGDVTEEIIETQIEGDVIVTLTVSRGDETTHHTQFNLYSESKATVLSAEELNELRTEVAKQLSTWSEVIFNSLSNMLFFNLFYVFSLHQI